jgi:uncharacterized membrane protein YphA (DoxX/SURF4 family)
MKKIIDNSYINLIFRIVLGTMFLLAAVSKAADPASFAQEIANYKILPDILINLMAIVLPWIELFASLFIIIGIRIKSSVLIISSLIIVFNIAIIIAMAKGLNINCGCHTKVMAEMVGLQKIIENMCLLILGIFIFYSKGIKFTMENYILKKSVLAKMSFMKNLN